MRDDTAGGGRGEVGAQEEGVRAGEGSEQCTAGGLGLLWVDVHAGADGGVGELDRVVNAVTGDQRGCALTAQFDRDMAGGVAGGGDQAQARGDPRALGRDVDQVEQTGLLDRNHRVAEHLAARLLHVVRGPELPFGACGEVARPGERGDPRAVLLPGVPADVVGVQVGEDHQVDGAGREAGGGQALGVVGAQVVPGRVGPFLAVADAGVDEHAQPVHDERETVAVDAEDAVVAGEVGAQPVLAGHYLRRGVGQQPGSGRGRQQCLVDAVDGDVAHGPGGDGGVRGSLHDLSFPLFFGGVVGCAACRRASFGCVPPRRAR